MQYSKDSDFPILGISFKEENLIFDEERLNSLRDQEIKVFAYPPDEEDALASLSISIQTT